MGCWLGRTCASLFMMSGVVKNRRNKDAVGIAYIVWWVTGWTMNTYKLVLTKYTN